MNHEIDVDRLRDDLEDYYGTAMNNASQIAVMTLSQVERASDSELIKMAEEMGVDLDKYID